MLAKTAAKCTEASWLESTSFTVSEILVAKALTLAKFSGLLPSIKIGTLLKSKFLVLEILCKGYRTPQFLAKGSNAERGRLPAVWRTNASLKLQFFHTSTPAGNGSRGIYYDAYSSGQAINTSGELYGLPSTFAYPVRCQKE